MKTLGDEDDEHDDETAVNVARVGGGAQGIQRTFDDERRRASAESERRDERNKMKNHIK